MKNYWRLLPRKHLPMLLVVAAGFALIASLTWLVTQPALAQTPSPYYADIYFFWGDGCPHCAQAKPFLEGLAQRFPQVRVHSYEVWYNQTNQNLLAQMAKAYNFEPKYVPTIFIGDLHWEGYSSTISQEIEKAVAACLAAGCRNAGAGVIPGMEPNAPTTTPSNSSPAQPDSETDQTIEIPLIGKVNLGQQSLLASTLLIAFVDGVNPCSVWVLTMLLAITLHTGSRKKVLLIGLVFLTVTAAVYALFIAGLFTLLTVVRFTGWVQVVVALVALVFGLINIKDYFWYKKGVSLTIADEQKPGLLKRMRALLDGSQSFWGLLGATVLLAGGVSLVEFSCTAGFPVIWTNLLSTQGVEPLTFVLLLLIYLIIYQFDELVIFFAAVFTLRATRLEEKHGRLLKLVGGVLMLTLAVVMIANPTLMSSLSNSLWIFMIAAGVILLVLLLHRTILPRFGIWIGDEARSRGRAKRARRR